MDTSPAIEGPRATLVTTWTLRLLGPALLLGALVTELVVIGTSAGDLDWLRWILVAGTVAAGVVLVLRLSPRVRTVTLAAAGALLLVAPGAWAVQTLGHPTSGTFPAGGPESAGGGFGGPGGGGGGARRFRAGTNGARAGVPGGATAPGGSQAGGAGGATRGGFGGGGGLGGGNTRTLQQALDYSSSHGGGVVAVSSQNGAASQLITKDGGARVAAIGGFSGRESQVTVDWLADAVQDGRIRFVLADATGGGGMRDGRVGASDVLALSAKVGKAVPSVDGLYDLQGLAAKLRAAR